ncbi:hypothetical protein AVEN_143582-1 [Araneus ventricosus]|uniref:Uncharacterized protein n=1 Tax=Araneus ventricosus TaxID=182803 RepID=A0A4Y2AQF7_ARAVE|nr:hypothetical protein AVEN_143582-1 [Araneus ventricosus]
MPYSKRKENKCKKRQSLVILHCQIPVTLFHVGAEDAMLGSSPLQLGSLVLSMFHNMFDTVPKRPVGNIDNLYFVLDGGALIHRVVWPKQETFGDVYTTYTLCPKSL